MPLQTYLPRPGLGERFVEGAHFLDVAQDVTVFLVVEDHVDTAPVVKGLQHAYDVRVTQTWPHIQFTGQKLGLEIGRGSVSESKEVYVLLRGTLTHTYTHIL